LHPFIDGISSYSLFVTLGTITGGVVMAALVFWESRKFIKSVFVSALFLLMILAGLYAAALLRKLTYWEFRTFSEFLSKLWQYEGRHFLGAVLFAVIVYPFVFKLIMRGKRVLTPDGFPQIQNASAFCIGIEQIFNRIACFLNGCCYGRPYTGIGSLKFPGITHRVYPTQLIEIFGIAAVLAVCYARWLKKKDGNIFSFFCVGFAAVIFVSEIFIDQVGTLRVMGMSFIQLAAILLAVLGVIQHQTKKMKQNNK